MKQPLTGADVGKLNPFIGIWNIAWAPYRSHTPEYGSDVFSRLLEVRGKPAEIRRVLQGIARDFIAGNWDTHGLPGEPDDD